MVVMTVKKMSWRRSLVWS